jgi:tetratricopeptide (TPR) repeat protein
MSDGKYDQALVDFRAALEYPDNLEVGRPAAGGRDAEVYYCIGTALDALGDNEPARKAFECSAQASADPSEMTYFQGLSWKRLGRDSDAGRCFELLIRFARAKLAQSASLDYFAKFGEKESAKRREANLHYLLGLGLRGLGKDAEAEAEFKRGLRLYPHFSRIKRLLHR